MSESIKLPPGVRLSANQTSAPLTKGKAIGGPDILFEAPEMEGLVCQVQHPVESGKGPTQVPGVLGIGIWMTPYGPTFLLQIKHADGTNLAAVLCPDEHRAFGEIYARAAVTARLAAGQTAGRA